MLSRRNFGACAICSAVGLVASRAEAQPSPSGQILVQDPTRKLTLLRRTDLPGGTHEVVQMLSELQPNATSSRHTHPGIESVVVLEGSGEQRQQADEQTHAAAGRVAQPRQQLQAAPAGQHHHRHGLLT